MVDKQKIEELIEAGEEATSDEWVRHRYAKSCLLRKDQRGQSVCSASWHNGEENEQCLLDIDFIAKAANARPEIKAMLEENKRQAEVIEIMEEALKLSKVSIEENAEDVIWVKGCGAVHESVCDLIENILDSVQSVENDR